MGVEGVLRQDLASGDLKNPTDLGRNGRNNTRICNEMRRISVAVLPPRLFVWFNSTATREPEGKHARLATVTDRKRKRNRNRICSRPKALGNPYPLQPLNQPNRGANRAFKRESFGSSGSFGSCVHRLIDPYAGCSVVRNPKSKRRSGNCFGLGASFGQVDYIRWLLGLLRLALF
ncbi:uncharacterized protein PADG_03491 [Paracoccidioides brasiliensis Pb18]|uniref:Uncharacterized protein n=1 Tax=Paracoccidioides brasiliensis (strain Pb18) TaxID=502780 RepID=C1G5C1_PARBD|nr:uncharacterized protein PADG_03491 [Paracoccidioides brasiliensis Pb18]EEH47393.2 hypothetical protein PADG_03491 [Paracoccidioides brasiliensis Pb18]